MHRTMLTLLLLAAVAPMAQAQTVRATTPARARIAQMGNSEDGDRAMLGVSTGSGGKRDTLGLLIESITPGSPAEKAGLEEGNRIASINGVGLRLSREDAGEPDMSGTMTNRLMREMRKIKAGDEVTLEVWSGGRNKTVKAKTVAADDLSPARVSRQAEEDRAALGISLGSNGSKRDTLGVFVSSVSDNGPADKAGIAEGDRIASINGTDLRVQKDDIGDWSVANARVQRLQREVRKLKPGQSVDLVVVEGGRSRTVKVTLGRAKDLEHTNGFNFSTGDGGSFITMPRIPMPAMAPMRPMEPMEPMAPMRPMAPRARGRVIIGDGDGDVDFNFDALRESLREIGPHIRAEVEAAMPEMRMELDRDLPRAMDEMRAQLQRFRGEMPMIRARAMRGVII